MKREEDIKIVSPFQYALLEIAGQDEGYRPRTRQEENERQEADLRRQLGSLSIVKPNGEREPIDVEETLNKLKKL